MKKALTSKRAEEILNAVNQFLDDGEEPEIYVCTRAGEVTLEDFAKLVTAVKEHRKHQINPMRQVSPVKTLRGNQKLQWWGQGDVLTFQNEPQVLHRNPVFVLDGEEVELYRLDPRSCAGYGFIADADIELGRSPKIPHGMEVDQKEKEKIRQIMRWREIVWASDGRLVPSEPLLLARLVRGLVPG